MKLLQNCITLLLMLSVLIISCKKDSRYIAPETKTISHPVTAGVPLCGGISGTMVSGNTYIIDSCGVIINAGDTLTIQSGVKVIVNHGGGFTVRGVMLSLGTKSAPVWMTSPGPNPRTDNPQTPYTTDSAYSGKWLGIQCDTSCTLLVLKWTHVEYTGGVIANQTIPALGAGKNCYSIVFERYPASLVVEDCWFYGTTDDCIRIQGGSFAIMRSTFEKMGNGTGDGINVKHGSVGIAAYNLFVGSSTNATKASDKGSNTGVPICDYDMYNNTYVNGGWRSAANTAGKGANINYEQNSFGSYYNNLVVNCIYGPRVVGNPSAAISQMHYGNTFYYGDSINAVDGFYPVGYVTIPQTSDIPLPSSYLSSGYLDTALMGTGDELYNAPQLVGKNNPLFVNYPLPCPSGFVIAYVSGFDFHLQSGSPCIGKGNTTFTQMATPVPIDANYGASPITPPGADIGCYQSDGTGNQH